MRQMLKTIAVLFTFVGAAVAGPIESHQPAIQNVGTSTAPAYAVSSGSVSGQLDVQRIRLKQDGTLIQTAADLRGIAALPLPAGDTNYLQATSDGVQTTGFKASSGTVNFFNFVQTGGRYGRLTSSGFERFATTTGDDDFYRNLYYGPTSNPGLDPKHLYAETHGGIIFYTYGGTQGYYTIIGKGDAGDATLSVVAGHSITPAYVYTPNNVLFGAAVRFSNFDCTGFMNGGKLSTDSSGNVVCRDDAVGMSTGVFAANGSPGVVDHAVTADKWANVAFPTFVGPGTVYWDGTKFTTSTATGDMLKTTYDTNSNGVVDAAESLTYQVSIPTGTTGNLPANRVAAGSLSSSVITSSAAVGSVGDAQITGVSGTKISGNIAGNAANVIGVVAISSGGTGSSTALAARAALGVQISTDVQAWNSNLDELAGGHISGTKVTAGVPAANIAAGSLGSSVIASSEAAASVGNAQISSMSATKLTEAVAIANGGTGGTTALAARGNLGVQAASSNLDLITAGAWPGSQVTGNIPGNAANVTGVVAISSGGTGSSTASAARTALGLAIGTNVQAWNTNLDDLADGSLTGSKIGAGIIAANIAAGSLGSGVISSSQAAASVGDAQISGVSGAKVSGNIAGNAAGLTTTLSTGQGGTGATTYTSGQLLIGNGSGGLTKATLTAGTTNVTITNSSGAISISVSSSLSGAAGSTVTFTNTLTNGVTTYWGTISSDTVQRIFVVQGGTVTYPPVELRGMTETSSNTATGYMNFQSSVTLPTSAAPPVDSQGKIGFRTTDKAFIGHDGVGQFIVGRATHSFTVGLSSGTGWDNLTLPVWRAPADLSVLLRSCTETVLNGTSLTFNLEKRPFGSISSSSTTITGSALVATAGGATTGSFTAGDIAAKSYLMFVTSSGAAVGAVDAVTFTCEYSEDIQ